MKFEVIKSRFNSLRTPERWIAIDTETTGLNYWIGARVFSLGIVDDTEEGNILYWEWPVDPLTREVTYNPKDIEELKTILADESTAKIFHNAKFDLQGLQFMGITDVRGRVEDTSFAARICNTQELSYGLKPLAKKYYDFPDDDLATLKKVVQRLRALAKKRGWAIHPEDLEADYWLVQHAEELGWPKEEAEEVKGMAERYCQGDIIRTSLLWRLYEKLLDTEPLWRKTYEKELRLLPEVMDMEAYGMAISRERNRKELEVAIKNREKHLAELQKLAGRYRFLDAKGKPVEFNPGSPKQLVKLLYGKEHGAFGLEVKKWTKTREPSTDWKALREHLGHPFVRELFAFRSADKAIETFFGKYEQLMQDDELKTSDDIGILHPSLNQCGTVTGRFSCNDPNLQQVANSNTSARGAEPIQARAPFGPRKGFYWYPADFSQMELRVFADVAQVDSMVEALREGKDLNTEMANRIWGGKNNPYAVEAAAIALELGHHEPSKPEIVEAWEMLDWSPARAKHGVKSSVALQTAEDWLRKFDYQIVAAEKTLGKTLARSRQKVVTFCKIYGGGPKAVLDLLYCTMDEAVAYWRQYDSAYPEIKDYIRRCSDKAARDGYVINRYGRKLNVDSEFSYRAVNYMVQGSCADLMKEGIWKVGQFYKSTGLEARLVITIHDELIPEVRIGHDKKWLLRETCRLMSDHGGAFNVDMPVEMKLVRERWDRKESIEL